jgi:hypothetical protein
MIEDIKGYKVPFTMTYTGYKYVGAKSPAEARKIVLDLDYDKLSRHIHDSDMEVDINSITEET